MPTTLYIKLDIRCDKQVTVVGQTLTILATVIQYTMVKFFLPSPEFRTKFQAKEPLVVELPEFPLME